ncbi:MAG TPA: DNA-binding domain-containing protein [Polyangiaceae bacterium]|nr:DNA-binding domain-containing protein [Polyangiaceae bacterium]
MGELASLNELEEQLARMLTRRGALERDPEAIALANRYLTGNDRLSPVEQLEIYREQFWLRHTQALVEDFPGVGGIVGQTGWERLAEGYLSAFVPTSYTLRNLGEKFADFVASQTDVEHHALVTDMARLEWAYVELFDAEDPPPLSLEELGKYGEEELGRARLRLSPGVRLLNVSFPVVELRKQILLAEGTAVPLPSPESCNLVVYRADLAILHERLDEEAFTLLDALSRGESLMHACESACALGPEATAHVAEHVGEWLARWVRLKWIVAVAV